MTVLLLAAVAMSAVMAIGWLVQESLGNGGLADVFWTFGLGGVGALMAVLSNASLHGCLVAILAAVWGLRLGIHILDRARTGPEDSRYAALRQEWGPSARWRMFIFLQIQAVASWLLLLAFWAAAGSRPGITPLDFAGIAVALVALCGEALADWQLRAFKRRHTGHGGICRTGLWRLSRHPNYFFEWLFWFAFPLIAAPSPAAWLTLIAPALMYWLLVHVSGIPPLEAQMLRSRGEAFRIYQAEVRPFFPLPKGRRA